MNRPVVVAVAVVFVNVFANEKSREEMGGQEEEIFIDNKSNQIRETMTKTPIYLPLR